MKNTKCDCGHNNPVGTILCEYCGKPLEEEESSGQPLEMRYEGKARRSQKRHKTLLDRVWNFFSSVKVAIYLIVITLVASILGTIFPQERFIGTGRPDVYYAQEYGIWGDLYYKLGLSDMYSSWWYVTLLAMIGISLVICSLDRVIPLYQALKKQRVTKSTVFITRQRVSRRIEISEDEKESALGALSEQLIKKRYHVRNEGDSLLAEKGRFSRWGPYVNHIGLIIFLFGALMRLIPGWYMDEAIYVREGETKKLPDLNYYVKNEKAIMEYYDEKESRLQADQNQSIVKNYETRAVLYEKDPDTGKLKELKRQSIIVNKPFKYEDLLLFQADFKPDQTQAMKLTIQDQKEKKDLGTIRIDLYDPQMEYTVQKDGVKVRILDYFPDFVMEGNRPTTQSETPNRPAFIFEVQSDQMDEPEKSWLIAGANLDDLNENNRYTMKLAGLETVNMSGLMVRMDKSLPVIFIGLGIFMVGLCMGFFWYHRRVWIQWKDGTLYVGAHTNKNWFGLRQDLEQVTQKADLPLSFSPKRT